MLILSMDFFVWLLLSSLSLLLAVVVLLLSLIYFSQEDLSEISRKTHRNLTEILTHSQ